MVQGNKIHKELENELHEMISLVHIPSSEESWALKLLNILFGLSELETHGITV
jgi:Exonuclease V - a 5' deoxyribonuclease